MGTGEDAHHLTDEIMRNPSFGFNLKGYFHDVESSNMNRYCTYLGSQDKIQSYLQKHKVGFLNKLIKTGFHKFQSS